MARVCPDRAAAWVRKASPDDDWLPAANPKADGREIAPHDPKEGMGAESLALDVDRLPLRENPLWRAGTRSLRRERIGFDGLISSALGRLTPSEFEQARRDGKIEEDGSLKVPPTNVRQKKVRGRATGARPSTFTIALTLEEYRQAEKGRREAEAEAERVRTEARVWAEHERAEAAREAAARLPSGIRFEFGRRSPPVPARAHVEEGIEDWSPLDTEAFYPEDWDFLKEDLEAVDDPAGGDEYELQAWRFGDPEVDDRPQWAIDHGVSAAELEGTRRKDQESEVARLVAAWGAEIQAHQEDGDERFAPDPRCQNPNGCQNPAKPRGTRCGACYAYWRAPGHRGEERPPRLLNRERRRKGA